ncbi:PAS domain S-box protein [Humisphaera borealis]|uniref:histidine kinase n=1 Tax=Humisphaera borealis TaxID=2807512 RepID=A0A7M2WZ08_9BACT|nr:PAS domain S-box protein [Humisphaera borealis]QOV90669.1 PAS domain S-box protein [Humisphaera borealis]
MITASKELRQKQLRLFDAISSTTPDFIYVFDLEGRFVYANRRLLEVWGTCYDDALGKSFIELGYPQWHADMHLREIRQVIDTRQQIKGEVPFTGGSGISGVYEYIFSPVLGPDGEVELIAGTTRDVTDRRRLEIDQQRLLHELGNERSRLEAVIDKAPAFICVLRGPQHVYEVANEQYYRLVGRRGIIGKPLHEALPELAGQGIWELLDGVFGKGESFSAQEMPVRFGRGNDGQLEERFVNFVCQPLREVHGEISGIFVHGVDVTDAVRARQALEQSESQFRLIADAIPQIAWAARPDGIVDYYNRRWFEYIGMPETAGEEIRWDSHLHPDELRRVSETWAHSIQTGEPYFTEFRVRNSEGRYRWFLVRALPAKDASGRIIRWLGTCTDVDDQKSSEAALRASQERYRSLFNSIDQGFCVVEMIFDADRKPVDYRFLEINPAFESQTGLVNAIGRTALDMIPELEDRWLKVYGGVVVSGEPVRFEESSEAMGRWFDVYAFRVGDRAGGKVAILFKDITSSKQIESALRDSERRFREMADTAPAILWVTEPDGSCSFLSRGWYEMTGQTPEEALGLGWVNAAHPDDRSAAAKAFVDANTARCPYAVDFRVRQADGAYRWVIDAGRPRFSHTGEFQGFVGSVIDITDRRRIEQERQLLLESEQAARAEAERASRMKDEFLATLSHELRTPLNAILGWAQILNSGPGNPADVREGVEIIERNARAQTQIIEDLLDMSRIISGKIHLNVQRFDLIEILRVAVETVRPAASAKGVRLHHVLDGAPALVLGDPNRLQQVFWNLLTNAVKFTPRGGHVQVLVNWTDAQVEVNVIDTGEGIDGKFLPHVFDRFRQADATTTRRHGGLGLGLAIVKQLVELHGGTVSVRSSGRGFGSSFTVSLPRTDIHPELSSADADDPSVPAPVTASADAVASLGGVKVLVVDDESDARALVRRLLEDCDAVVSTAASAQEAWERLQIDRPDVLVSDIGMPGEDGYSLIRRVRDLPAERGGRTPAVALTAYARAEDRMKAVVAGFEMHVVKPVEPAELITMVATLAKRAET